MKTTTIIVGVLACVAHATQTPVGDLEAWGYANRDLQINRTMPVRPWYPAIGPNVCPIEEPWDDGSYWWSDEIHFERYATPCEFGPVLRVLHRGVVVTFRSDNLRIDDLDPELHSVESLGTRALRGGEVVRMEFDPPVDFIEVHLAAHDCDTEVQPSLYCYHSAFYISQQVGYDVPMSGDCQLGNQVGCSPTGPESCATFQWYFAASWWDILTGDVLPIEWCEFVSNGREAFVGAIGFDAWEGN